MLKVSSIEELRAAFAELARTLSRQYLLSYPEDRSGPTRARERAYQQRCCDDELRHSRHACAVTGAELLVYGAGRGRRRLRDHRDTRCACTGLRPRTPKSASI